MNLNIREVRLTVPFLSAYKKLLKESPHTTPFHTIEWLEVSRVWVSNSSVSFIILEDRGQLVGAMPVVKRHFGPLTFFFSLPFGTYGGFVTIKKLPPIKGWDRWLLPKGGMSQVVDLWKTLGPSPNFNVQREVCHILQLPDSYDEIFYGIYDRTQRKTLRAAKKRGLVDSPLETEQELNLFYPLYVQMDQRKGTTPIPKQHLKRAMEVLVPAGIWRGFLARVGEKVLGGIISLFHPKMSVAFISGYSDEGRKYKTMNFLIDRTLRDSIERGSLLFNLGTTPGGDPGVIRFKESFGAKPHIYPVYTRKSGLYSIFVKVRKK